MSFQKCRERESIPWHNNVWPKTKWVERWSKETPSPSLFHYKTSTISFHNVFLSPLSLSSNMNTLYMYLYLSHLPHVSKLFIDPKPNLLSCLLYFIQRKNWGKWQQFFLPRIWLKHVLQIYKIPEKDGNGQMKMKIFKMNRINQECVWQ